MARSAPGPDFIGIGSTRCGTTFLHASLRRHPGLWLPPIKELHYFDRGCGSLGDRTRRLARLAPRIRRAWRARRRDPAAAADLRFYGRYLAGARDIAAYGRWFDGPRDRVRGEITPAYCTLEDRRIAEIAGAFPGLRVVFMMRDPIDRAWSAVAKSLARERARPVSEVPPEEWKRKFGSRGFRLRSDYLGILDRWERHVPRERIFVGFLEDLEADVAQFLSRLCPFLGVETPEVDGSARASGRNASGGGRVPPEVERILAAEFVEMNRRLAERFGSHASAWYERARSAVA